MAHQFLYAICCVGIMTGGRTSTRQADQFQFDHGAQFLRLGPQQRGGEATEAPAEVVEQVRRWKQEGAGRDGWSLECNVSTHACEAVMERHGLSRTARLSICTRGSATVP